MISLHLERFSFEKEGQVLVISGTLLKEGTFRGLDKREIFYPASVVEEATETILGKPIKLTHAKTDRAVAGFVTSALIEDGEIKITGYIHKPDVIDLILKGKYNGLSMEADGVIEFDPERKSYVARSLTFRGVALVENPACVQCRVDTAKLVELPVVLSTPEFSYLALSSCPDSEVTLEVEMEEEIFLVGDLQRRPTKEAFFRFIRDKMKAAGIPEEHLDKIINVLEGIIKIPYPYPYPRPYPPIYPYPYPKRRGESPEEEPEFSLEDLLKKFEELKNAFEEHQKGCTIIEEVKASLSNINERLEKLEKAKTRVTITQEEKKEDIKLTVPKEEKKDEPNVDQHLEELFGTSDLKKILR